MCQMPFTLCGGHTPYYMKLSYLSKITMCQMPFTLCGGHTPYYMKYQLHCKNNDTPCKKTWLTVGIRRKNYKKLYSNPIIFSDKTNKYNLPLQKYHSHFSNLLLLHLTLLLIFGF
jgi:hypothetical protein